LLYQVGRGVPPLRQKTKDKKTKDKKKKYILIYEKNQLRYITKHRGGQHLYTPFSRPKERVRKNGEGPAAQSAAGGGLVFTTRSTVGWENGADLGG